MKTVENVRRTCADSERDPILKQMSEEGYSLVAVTDDGWSDGRVRFHYWSLYFTQVTDAPRVRVVMDATKMCRPGDEPLA